MQRQLKHLLIVDDEPSVLGVLKLFFERQGHTVTTATNGAEAIERAIAVKPEFIILDIQMPVKLGTQVVQELRAMPAFEEVPIIALTAYARDIRPSDLYVLGFDEVLPKPFDFAELQEIIQNPPRRGVRR
jgi:CheY-like chemotaxis protein